MTRARAGAVSWVVVALASCLLAGDARPADPPSARLPFSDDVAPPPPLATPIDRAFKGELVSFDGERVTLRWDWKTAEHLADFESFVPVRSTLTGGFTVKDGRVRADGTAGIRLRLAFLSDLDVKVGPTILRDPHDLGIVLPAPGSSDESILCLVQDKLFTRFDRAAGNTNMINKMGGIVSPTPGMVEFRYVDRRIQPRIAPDAEVTFDVARRGAETSFTIAPKGGDATTLKGRDTDTAMTRFTPGLYVSGGAADFGPLTIGGKLDAAWCAEHGVLPYFAGNLLHPGNKWKPPEKKLAELVEKFAQQGVDAKQPVPVEAIAPLVGDVKVPLVIRIRAAEALLDQGAADAVAGRLAVLLDSRDQPARTLAWQILRPRLPWHFRYEVDADPKVRREAALMIGEYIRDREANESQGKTFVDGHWYTPERADDVRAEWASAWELRTPRIRLRTNLSRRWADWYLAALEAEYLELVRLVGREAPRTSMPFSVFVFKDAAGFADFCKQNGYEAKAAWGRFVDLDRNVTFVTFDKRDGLANAMGQFAKQFHRAATGKFWPAWYDEGRAAWFGNAEYQTVSFDGTTLKVGLRAQGGAMQMLKQAAAEGRMPPIVDTIAKDPRALDVDKRRIWYAEVWALHAWLVGDAPEETRRKFAEWQSLMEKLPTTPRDVEDTGLMQFLGFFKNELGELDRLFAEWVTKL
jgi:hypothetical protein